MRLHFIEPGKPIQNAYVESFQGKLRDKCLNGYWFLNLADARRTLAEWRTTYNRVRSHSTLGYVTPEEFAEADLRRVEDLPTLSPAPNPRSGTGHWQLLQTT